jgi:phage FluMu protein Com
MVQGVMVDVRCSHCGALLAKRGKDELCIRRGEMQTRIRGADARVEMRCYRCKAEQLVHGDAPRIAARAS